MKNHQQTIPAGYCPGECWSLRSIDAGETPAVLLIETPDDETRQAAPLFMEGGQALETDVRLDPSPAWLFGEHWCALGQVQPVAVQRLFRRLGVLSASLLQTVRAAYRGESSPLPRGPRMMPGLDDPRKEFHRNLAERTRRCGTLPAIERIRVTIRRLTGQAGERIEAALDEAARNVERVLTPIPVPALVTRHAQAMVADGAPTPGAWRLPLADGRTLDLYLQMSPAGNTVMIQADDVRHIEFQRPDSAVFEPCRRIGQTWMAGDLSPLESGRHRFRLASAVGGPDQVIELEMP